jgi:hypothetical protein
MQSLILSWSLSLYVWKYRKFSEAAFVPVFAATKSIVRDIDDIGTIPRAEAKARAAILRRNVGSKT